MSFILKCARPRISACLMLAAALLAPVAARALDPNLPPSGNFDLSHWYLGLPVDSSGGTTGNSASITTAQLLAGYTNALYFYTGPDGAMTFWAPVTGATTSGSSYPRSELRELLSPPSTATNWLGYGLHTLDAQCKVLEVPSSKKVIIGQIHGFTGSALPLVKIQYNNGTIEGLVKTNADDDGSDFKFTYANVGLSNTVNYQIKVLNGLVSIGVNGVTNSMNVFQTDPNWATNTLYFKAGSYCQDNVGTTNEGARVAFYSVVLSHAPSITNQPISQTVWAGSNASFTVGAIGNPPLTYRWRLNTTNISGATNSSLTLANVQSTNAGDYTVVINDRISSITSVVATLTVNLPTNNVPTNTFYRWDADTNSAGIQDGVGTWTNVNWSAIGDGSDDTSWVQASDAVFGGGTSGTAGAITINSVRVGNITFNQPFAGNYTITGSTLTLTNGPTITVNNGGDATLSSNLRGDNGFIKDGPGTLTINTGTSNYYTGPIVVTNGTLIITSGSGKPTVDAGGVQVYTNGTFQYASGKTGLISSNASLINNGGTIQWGSTETQPLVNFVLKGGLVTNNTTSDRTILVAGSYLVESGTFTFNPNIAGGTTNAKAIILAGTAGLTKTTAGTVYILGNFNNAALGQSIKNSYMGITTISGGVLNIGFDRAIGTNPPAFSPNQLTLDGGTLQIAAGYTWGDNRGVTLTANGGAIDTMSNVTQTIPVPIAGSAGGSLTKAGSGTLTLATNNTYDGNTTVSNGTLALSGNGSISNSPVITVAGGAGFDVDGLTIPLTLGNSQALRASGTTSAGTIATAAGAGLALGATSSLQFSAFNGTNAPLTITGNGTVALSAGNVVTVTVAHGGTPLGAGDYKLISTNGAGGMVSGAAPSAVTVNGDGLAGGVTASIAINSAELFLHVAAVSSVNTNATNISSSSVGGNLTLSWPSDHTGWTLQTQTNALSVGLKTNWFDVTGSAGTNQVILPVGTVNGTVFFRLRYP